ncbi:hypothetical protein J4E91_009100 [Alternaria rosae]|nr:hypothetical protein J4E91_009100 [Alternaria rosae]
MAARMAALSSECKEKLKATSKRSQFYDKSAPSTIAKRNNYFEYCKTIYEIEDENTMYSRETLIDFVCGFVECMATASEGVLSDKPKAFHIQILTLIKK